MEKPASTETLERAISIGKPGDFDTEEKSIEEWAELDSAVLFAEMLGQNTLHSQQKRAVELHIPQPFRFFSTPESEYNVTSYLPPDEYLASHIGINGKFGESDTEYV